MHERPLGRLAAGLCLAALSGVAPPAHAQTRAETERAVRAVADGVLRDATFDFVDSATVRKFVV